MRAKPRRAADNSAAFYIADLTTELAGIAAGEGYQYLAQILQMAHREAQGLCGGAEVNRPQARADRPSRIH